MPWPDVRGKRCLDVGHLRRLPRVRARAPRRGRGGGDRHRGPHALGLAGAHAGARARSGSRRSPVSARGSASTSPRRRSARPVERVERSVYDLDPGAGRRASTSSSAAASCSTCATRCARSRRSAASAAARSCRPSRSTRGSRCLRGGARPPRSAAARACSGGSRTSPGHRAMVEAGGFSVDAGPRRYRIPLGAGHPARRGRAAAWRTRRCSPQPEV